jgi:hypothetical protein
MDRDEAMKLLKGGRERVGEWNRRRSEGEAIPDLRGAQLDGADLSGADLVGADLGGAALRDADLSAADLSGSNLRVAALRGTKLVRADLCRATLVGATLIGANLRGANLIETDLSAAKLRGAELGGAICSETILGNLDLSTALGLDSVRHDGPSTIGTDTLVHSAGKIPDAFLRGCGLPDTLIAYLPALIGSMSPIQFYSVFISYSSRDQAFAERLHADLQSRGVRCWYAPRELKIGDLYRVRIDESIRVYDKLLLVLTEGSVASPEVAEEVRLAMAQEEFRAGTVLFPIRLDDAVMKASSGWPASVRHSRHIGDFTGWKDHDAYTRAFDRLLRDLKAEASRSAGGPSDG